MPGRLQKLSKAHRWRNGRRSMRDPQWIGLNSIRRVWKRATIVCEESSTPFKIKLSVIMPYYRAGFIGWVPLESLIRQKGVNFDWELVIMEENRDNPFGYDRVLQYWEALQKVGCRRIKYISIPKWMALSGKWYYLIQNTDLTSEVICCNSADIYMSKNRLAAQYAMLGGNTPYNWFKLSGNLVYDIHSDRHAKLVSLDPKRTDTCCRAARSELFRKLRLVYRAKTLDRWMYESIAKHIRFYYDRSDMWKDTVNITGLNNFSLGRGERVRTLEPPLKSCCGSLEKHLPREVVQKLRECRKFMSAHNRLINKTRKW